MLPTPSAASRGTRAAAVRRGACGILIAAALTASIAGCSLVEQVIPAPLPAPVIPDPPVDPPVLVPGGTAEENLPFFTETLRAYARSDAPIEGRPIIDALALAGFSKKQMQVSFDRTKTGLVADNIFVSVRIDDECLIGQFLTGNRDVTAEAAPAVGPDRELCLIGNTRTIDW